VIKKIQVSGMAIIEKLEIEFGAGFNVITGETGAGKSILIKALSFLLGHRAHVDLIRKGFDQATVNAEFVLHPEHEAVGFLKEKGLPFEESEEISLLVRRAINQKGRTSAWINDVSISQSALKELGLSLVDIFGQHDHQKLLKPEFHLSYVDLFLEEGCLRHYQDLFSKVKNQINQLDEKIHRFVGGQKDLDYFQYRLRELEELSPSVEDYQRIKDLSETSRGSLEITQALTESIQNLEEDNAGVNRVLWETSKKIGRLNQKIKSESLSKLQSQIEQAASEVDTICFEMNQLLSLYSVDEQNIEQAEKRIFEYQQQMRKHGVRSVEELMGSYQKLKTDCLSTEDLEKQIEEELRECTKRTQEVREFAKALSKKRLKTGLKIKHSVERELSELAMPGIVFDIAWQDVEQNDRDLSRILSGNSRLSSLAQQLDELWMNLSPQGFERAEFLLASNPGEPLLPLMKIASGGELSRMMLALKKALIADAETCLLVFDEIDTGISGRVADVVGKKMKELASTFQILCISHLPQVAVFADNHFLVKKEVGKKAGEVRTESTIVKLTREQSAAEIARLLSGSELSKAGLANAKALIAKAKKESGVKTGRLLEQSL